MHWPLSPPWQEGIGHNATYGAGSHRARDSLRTIIEHDRKDTEVSGRSQIGTLAQG
jgi:hypothetical protein